jgi:hypothetical protein
VLPLASDSKNNLQNLLYKTLLCLLLWLGQTSELCCGLGTSSTIPSLWKTKTSSHWEPPLETSLYPWRSKSLKISHRLRLSGLWNERNSSHYRFTKISHLKKMKIKIAYCCPFGSSTNVNSLSYFVTVINTIYEHPRKVGVNNSVYNILSKK